MLGYGGLNNNQLWSDAVFVRDLNGSLVLCALRDKAYKYDILYTRQDFTKLGEYICTGTRRST